MNVFDEFHKIAEAFEENHLAYALIGGVAMAFHGQPRFTKDIDIIILPDDFKKTKEILFNLDYAEKSQPWTFKNTNITLHKFTKIVGKEYLFLDILVGHEAIHKKIVENALTAESERGQVKVVKKEDLIWLKERRNSDQDKVDVNRLKNEKD